MPAIPPIPMPASDWWADRGLAVLLIGIIVAVCLVALREWWRVRRPHLVRLQEVLLAKEEKACKLYDTLTEDAPAKTLLMQQQSKLLVEIDQRQRDHAKECNGHGELLKGIAAKVEAWK